MSNEPDQLRRKDRERERHRHEILKSAERIFARKGYHATTVEEIAKEAEFAIGTLYKFFSGKDDLYTQVIEAFVQEFVSAFEQRVLAKEDAEEAIAALIELKLRHYQEHREFIRVAFEASLSCGDPVRSLPASLREAHARYTEAVRRIFERGIAQGTFDQADPLYLTLCLEGIVSAFLAYWSRNEPTESLNDRITKMRREFLGRIKIRLNDLPQPAAVN